MEKSRLPWRLRPPGQSDSAASGQAQEFQYAAEKPPKNTEAHLFRVGFTLSLPQQGDVRWENHFRRLRNRQKLCDWILRR
jgi:hypothetical protein